MGLNREGLKSQLAELQNNLDAIHSAATNSNIALGGKLTSTPQADNASLAPEPRFGIQNFLVEMIQGTYSTLDLLNENLYILNN